MSTQTNRYIRNALEGTETPPPIEARFFYTSPIPIDDPLSPLPPLQPRFASTKEPPKPFSEYDNAALEKAWLELRNNIREYEHEQIEKRRNDDFARERAKTASAVRRERADSGASSTAVAHRTTIPARLAASSLSHSDTPLPDLDISGDGGSGHVWESEVASVPDTTGTPFVRAPSSRTKMQPVDRETRPARPKAQAHDTYDWDHSSHLTEHGPTPGEEYGVRPCSPATKVPVGVSRLHQVEMPEWQMTPIYWTPVHDTAPVVRATWFYKETMLPVETSVANLLEAGYVGLQVWMDVWSDELNSAVEAGAAGEMKIVHKLWPEPTVTSTVRTSKSIAVGGEALVGTATSTLAVKSDTPEKVREKAVEAACKVIDIATGSDGVDNKASGSSVAELPEAARRYASFGVIYANKTEARLLKPSLLPSVYFGRKPLASYIRKGSKLGIAVVRGFDQAAWNKLHPSPTGPTPQKAKEGVATAASGVPPSIRQQMDPMLARSQVPKVTDLILVIHGIGQKLANRNENFHFTHAINSFRREINVELGSKGVQARLRKDVGGMMALPVNWRHSLSFDEGGYRDDDPAINEFTLEDITPETLPSVRNIVSDVMLDIPYYLSHHQPRMIAAVVKEANRVYQLWCKNNPGFANKGRVHIIAHSLGSVMAMDILSHQPTRVPNSLADPASLNLDAENLDHFLFDTRNLFLAGSPAGFFLLLKKAQLLPRAVYASTASNENSVVYGERGDYGCIAVENIYNIINPYDPVAYRMNAAVDAAYSASLKQAFIPSASPGWFGSSSKSSSLAAFAGTSTGASPATLTRLPSNVELETHNFTREQLAEERMSLLNDNGQIDFYLKYGGGLLEIQWLTMLGAHSSYWASADFVRCVVGECGRAGGKEGCFAGMKAVKRKVRVGG